jgi:hypothetical protein
LMNTVPGVELFFLMRKSSENRENVLSSTFFLWPAV